MQLSRASTRIGLFALLLGVIVLSLFGSLFAADRALARADREAVDLDAHGAALLLEREVRLDAEQLTLLFGPLLARANEDSTHMPQPFDAAWVVGQSGNAVWGQGTATTRVSAATVQELARAVAAANSSTPVIKAISDSGIGGILVGTPLAHRGAKLGAAVGYLEGKRLLHALEDGTSRRQWTALRFASRTFVSTGSLADGGAYLTSRALVRLPGDSIQI